MDSWNLPQELLVIWHTYRLPIVLSLIGLIALFQLFRHWSNTRTAHVHLEGHLPSVSRGSKEADTSQEELIEGKLGSYEVAVEKAVRPLEDVESNVRPKSVGPRRITGSKKGAASLKTHHEEDLAPVQPLIFYSSLGGTTEKAAISLQDNFLDSISKSSSLHQSLNILKPVAHDLSYIDYDDFFITAPKDAKFRYFYMLLLPTYNIDTQLDNFLEHLKETHHDFRIDTGPLSSILGYSVFGFGDKDGWPTEEEGFCSQAKEVDKWLAKLTNRKRAFPLGTGDVKSDAPEQLGRWRLGVEEVLKDLAQGRGLGEGVPGSGDPMESDEEDVQDESQNATSQRKRRRKPATSSDLEDINVPKADTGSGPIAIDFTHYSQRPTSSTPPSPLKEMVPASSPTHAALTKQGYTIIGSHSGVKICRWTKSALRGRGSCYKYSFYGIASHLCMEATPSLSCSNKCVFCWRHGTNPVGTIWRWATDPPDLILAGAKAAHYAKIRALRGVPGVRADRFVDATTRIRHCALSLVGEPIFYPRINELLKLLHAERVSTFLVCNAQHPEQLASLAKVTQLYVSIDASNKESLRRVDRPLHRDFWERFCRCLDILRERRLEQRTVFRLTLVKGFNLDEEAAGYAALVERARPAFVEVKGVTYCGTSVSAGAGLTMQNVPFYHEVRAFVAKLAEELRGRHGLGYGIAAEHAHSCCVLLGDETRFRKGGKWRTWIDYGRFFELLESGEEFGPEDYVGKETPAWALDGRGGFDPRDERVDRKGRRIEESKENAQVKVTEVAT
ncbi:hypothetical protein EV356DRAFT_571963 [Viridothelium virens]|uniref:tRNA 4-demethylwyosine synthase (AdoMet-dependent) n=1 Tax=Viridothelium virens TaxID=1048519 RepID=A0A6A6HP05_VIRVR|nr:hypothetical protein EV356DRAFT_571963 [Viridothelium virens]